MGVGGLWRRLGLELGQKGVGAVLEIGHDLLEGADEGLWNCGDSGVKVTILLGSVQRLFGSLQPLVVDREERGMTLQLVREIGSDVELELMAATSLNRR